MVQAPLPEALEALRQVTSVDDRVAVLRQLKNDIVGHDQRKEVLVRHGILPILVGFLDPDSRPSPPEQPAGAWTGEHEARLQTILVLGTIANGGRALVAPLRASGAISRLSASLRNRGQARLTTATLQALRNYAANLPDYTSLTLEDVGIFGDPREDESMAVLLGGSKNSRATTLIADIVAEVCRRSEEHRSYLMDTPLSEMFASLLAAWSISQGHIDNLQGDLLPVPPTSAVPRICSAVSAMIFNSTYAAGKFYLSEPLRRLLSSHHQHATNDPKQSLNFAPRHGFFNGQRALLPAVHIPIFKSVSFNGGSQAFPALGSLKPAGGGNTYTSLDNDIVPDAHHATAVCSWLLLITRAFRGSERLEVMRLLSIIYKAIDGDPLGSGLQRSGALQTTRERERQHVLVAVPMAVRLVQQASEGKAGGDEAEKRELALIKEHSTWVLALLIQPSKELQTAAVECGAIKHICAILKRSFDSVTLARPMWPARSNGSHDAQDGVDDACQLGDRGLPPEIDHAMCCRQAALEALASIAKKEDVHRKAIVESGVVSCIIDSLKPFPDGLAATLATKKMQISPKDGNVAEVILAACHAAKSMSRSVSLLRTSLIDAGIAKPIFSLLTHPSLDVRTAATDVCCNLLLDFSPMREDLMREGVIKILAEHSKRSEMALRLASLWALKHLVLGCEKSVKVQALEELGVGWLVQAIAGEPGGEVNGSIAGESIGGGKGSRGDGSLGNVGGGVSISGLSSSNAAGEQVDLLNPSTMDVDEPALAAGAEEDEKDEEEDEDEDGEIMYDDSSNTHYQSSSLRSTLQQPRAAAASSSTFDVERYLSTTRQMERDPGLRARRHDVAVQEQTLDFVRNLFNGDDCLYMVDHLLGAIGKEKMFELLTAKLVPVSKLSVGGGGGGNGSGSTMSKGTATSSSSVVYQPTELIASTIHILLHLANASPRHRLMLVSQKALLAAWLPHFSHPDRRVRVLCVWAVNSLTWIENEESRHEARRCIAELRAAGIVAVVRDMSRDTDLDVRERVKTAVSHFDSA